LNIYDASGLDPELSNIVFNKYFKAFTETKNLEHADILITGVNPIYVPRFITYAVCNCTNTNHVNYFTGTTKLISLQDMDLKVKLAKLSSTAEHTIRLMLYLTEAKYFAGDMLNMQRPKIPGNTLKGKSLGIIGYGRIGKQVHQIADAFGMICSWYDLEFATHSLTEILQTSDFITLHTSVSKDMKPIINKDNVCLIKDGAYVINTSRGEALDSEAIAAHIDRLGGVAVDVLATEGDMDIFNKLFSTGKNVIVTPHLGGFTLEDLKTTANMCFDALAEEIRRDTVPLDR
jgi:phosphoglycerate dehydrogenase-like enzyme